LLSQIFLGAILKYLIFEVESLGGLLVLEDDLLVVRNDDAVMKGPDKAMKQMLHVISVELLEKSISLDQHVDSSEYEGCQKYNG